MHMGEGSRRLGISAVLGDEKSLMSELTEMSAEFAPRRFALCEVWADEEDAGVVGWGMAFDDEAMLYLPESGLMARLSSAQRALRLTRSADRRVVWIDGRDRPS